MVPVFGALAVCKVTLEFEKDDYDFQNLLYFSKLVHMAKLDNSWLSEVDKGLIGV